MKNRKVRQIYEILFDKYGPQHWWPAETSDEVIIGAILTQNTNWSNVEKAIINLKQNDLCSLEKIANIENSDYLAQFIKPSGYYNIKANRLITVARELASPAATIFNLGRTEVNSAATFRDYLLNIKGIGPETADSILLYAYSLPIFVVDAYTKRLFSRLGLIPENYTYSETQKFFMDNLIHDVHLFNEYHALIVIHCKNVCKKKPDCEKCHIFPPTFMGGE